MKKRRNNLISIAMGKPQPWNDRQGNPLNDRELRLASRTWSDKQWEEYLHTVEVDQLEVLTPKYERLVNIKDVQASLEEYQAGREPEKTKPHLDISKEALKQSLGILTPRERQAIEAIFYQNMLPAQAARAMHVSRQRVESLVQNALKKLRQHLTSGNISRDLGDAGLHKKVG